MENRNQEHSPLALAAPEPTRQTANALIEAYSFYNDRLFGGRLPPALITYRARGRTLGYFSGSRFANARIGEATDEIALNPVALSVLGEADCLSTLVHEMFHLKIYWFSEHPERIGRMRSYHDWEFANGMEQIGLITSDTGRPGGKRTGGQMSHYIQEGGEFDRTTKELLGRGFTIDWKERVIGKSPYPTDKGSSEDPPRSRSYRDQSKRKFTCAGCGQNAWAKASAQIACLNNGCRGAPMILAA